MHSTSTDADTGGAVDEPTGRRAFTLAIAMQPPDRLLPLARAAEESGWDHIAMPDAFVYPRHTVGRYPRAQDGSRFWRHDTPFVDPWVGIPAMAAATERIGFYTNVTKMAIREPLTMAKTVASAAALAPGRIALGVGLAWMPEEFTATGHDKGTRGARLDEQITILRRCTTPGFHQFHGNHYNFDELAISPVPEEPVPVYVGGHSAAALERAARTGDGWISFPVSIDEVRDLTRDLRGRLVRLGRDPESFVYAVTPMVGATADDFSAVFEAGATDVITVPWYFYTGASESLEDQITGIKRFAEEVIHPCRAQHVGGRT